MGPFVGLLLSSPSKVQRTDGLKVKIIMAPSTWLEIKGTTQLLCSRTFLLLIPLIAQAVYTEAVMFTFSARRFCS